MDHRQRLPLADQRQIHPAAARGDPPFDGGRGWLLQLYPPHLILTVCRSYG